MSDVRGTKDTHGTRKDGVTEGQMGHGGTQGTRRPRMRTQRSRSNTRLTTSLASFPSTPLLGVAIDRVFSDALSNSTRTAPLSSVPTCLLSISHTARRIQLSLPFPLPFPTLFVCAL